MNIALYDALKGTINGEDEHNFSRFICAHAIMLALEGIPGIYIHSMLATGNDYEKLANTHHNRAINRHRWQADKLEQALVNIKSQHARALNALNDLIAIRIRQKAFQSQCDSIYLAFRFIVVWFLATKFGSPTKHFFV